MYLFGGLSLNVLKMFCAVSERRLCYEIAAQTTMDIDVVDCFFMKRNIELCNNEWDFGK